jgi:protocatechuate 3,4-dioxygenase beta subunit
MTEQHKSKNGTLHEHTLPVLPRRDALKGLGVLAVSGAALGAGGCGGSAPTAESAAIGERAGTSASAPATAAPGSSSSAAAGTASKPAAASAGAPTASTAGPASAAGSTGTPAAISGSSGSAAATSASGSSAVATSAGGSAAATGGVGGSAAGATASAAGSMSLDSLACIMSPAMTDGPFFVEEKLNRSDLIMGESDEAIVKALPLTLTLGVYSVSGMACKPASGLQVDIWHANALGIYSDVRSGAVQAMDTQGKKYLRGYQVTDEAGQVTFSTIYPGWYQSRTIHIHVKVRMPMGTDKAYDFTSQIFFEEALNSMVLSQAPYNKAPGMRMVLNDADHIYNGTASNTQKPPAGKTPPGEQMTAVLTKTATGYAAALKLGIKV